MSSAILDRPPVSRKEHQGTAVSSIAAAKATTTTTTTTTTKKKKKKKISARVYPMPNVIPMGSPEYRVSPGVTIHPFVSGELMNVLFWDLPDFPVERNYMKRLAETNVQQVLSRTWQDHLIITITTRIPNATELAAGMTEIKSWLEDGHHRREWWRRHVAAGNEELAPDAICIVEHVIDNDSELYDTYYHYNSGDAVESIEHKLDALIIKAAPIDPKTGDVWFRKCAFMKKASLVTIMNRISKETAAKNERKVTWDVKPDKDTGRSKSAVSNDVAAELLTRYMQDFIALDEFLYERVEGNHGRRKMNKAGKVENQKGCAGKPLYDTAMKVALAVMYRACGGKFHPNIMKAIDQYVDKYTFVGGSTDLEEANMEYNINRIIRDATPHSSDASEEPVSEHIRLDMRNSRKRFHLGLADTIHNLTAIVLHGPEAKEGAHKDWSGDKIETHKWFQNFIEQSRKTPLR